MIAVTGSDSPAADPAPFGEPDPSGEAARVETPFPKRRDLRNADKPYSPDDPDSNPTAEAAAAEAEPEEKDYGRAGRNLPAAIGMGLLIGGVVLASLIFLPISFLFIVLVGIVAAMWTGERTVTLRFPVPACHNGVGRLMVVATFIGGREALWVTFAASAGAVMLFTMVERRKNAVKDVSLSLFALTYVGLMACFIVYILTQPDGNYFVIIFLAAVVASDTGGYVFGVLWGKHPIAPRISPKKSWEGYLGSTVFAAVVATILAVTVVGAPFWTGLVIGAVIPAFATLGDFSESMIKRDLELRTWAPCCPVTAV